MDDLKAAGITPTSSHNIPYNKMASSSAATEALLHSLDSWDDFCNYVTVYGPQVVLLATLSAITVFRREMSCNRVFHNDDQEDEEDTTICAEKQQSCSTSHEEEELKFEQTDDLLEGAGSYCSGAPLISALVTWMHAFSSENHPGHMIEEVVVSDNDDDDNDTQEPKAAASSSSSLDFDLLDRAGNTFSGEPILAAITLYFLNQAKQQQQQQQEQKRRRQPSYDPFTKELPQDIHVRIAEFLHPRDVVTLACVNKSYREIVQGSERDDGNVDDDTPSSSSSSSSMPIWKSLWHRDYGWIISNWSVGQEAFRRSKIAKIPFSKQFYFRFGQSYLNYVLAGQTSNEQCLVGLHGNIYDISSFLTTHPGSPDTLQVHAGRDATRFFEDMNHSMVARRLAKKFCVVVDGRTNGQDADDDNDTSESCCGLYPTVHARLFESSSSSSGVRDDSEQALPTRVPSSESILHGRKQRRSVGTLNHIYQSYQKELVKVQKEIDRKYKHNTAVLGTVNPYYDPFRMEWLVWYTTTDLQTVYEELKLPVR